MSGLKEGSLALFFSGSPIRKTSDEDYLFFADRNFVYLTGIEQKENGAYDGKGRKRFS